MAQMFELRPSLGTAANDIKAHVEADRIQEVHEVENCRPKWIPLRFPEL
jgi:hypothetical protein